MQVWIEDDKPLGRSLFATALGYAANLPAIQMLGLGFSSLCNAASKEWSRWKQLQSNVLPPLCPIRLSANRSR